jgi:ubiquinone/menaquinone biosynthesis C-methylase UbiE
MYELKHILPGEPIPKGSLFHERRYRVSLKFLNDLKEKRFLLDIGCGNASQTEFFSRHFKNSIGIDLQYKRLKNTAGDLLSRSIKNIYLLGGDSENLPFKKETYDCITCFEVLEHVHNEDKTLLEMKRVLKKNGILIMSVPHRWWVFETHGANLPVLPWNRVPFFSWLPKNVHDLWARARIYTVDEIKELFIKHGFEQIETELLTAPMDVIKNQFLQKLLRSLIFKKDTTRIPFLASTIFICAKKST